MNGFSERLKKDILATFRRTPLRDIICNDETILMFGEHRCKTLSEAHHNEHIKAQMSYAANLLQYAKMENPNIINIKSLLTCERYSDIMAAIRKVRFEKLSIY